MARFRCVIEVGGQQIRLIYGWDRATGFFLSALGFHRRLVEYDSLTDGYRGLPGLLDALVDGGVVSREIVEEALEQLLVVDDVTEIDGPSARTVAEMVVNLRLAAGE